MKIDQLSFAYGQDIIFDHLSLAITPQSFTSIVGASGCGKSTLLKLIAGLIPHHAITQCPQNIGFVFQDPTLMPWRNVIENITLPAKIAGKDIQNADKILQLVGLQDYAAALPKHLSGGMKMRVSIARALLQKPQLLLLDEPFAALDEITRYQLEDELRSIHQTTGCTTILVTHSITESVYLSDRVLVLSPRPAHILTNIEINTSLKRDQQFRAQPEYLDTCERVSAALHQSMESS